MGSTRFGQTTGPINVCSCLKTCACQSYPSRESGWALGWRVGWGQLEGQGQRLWLVSEEHTACSSLCSSLPVYVPPLTWTSSRAHLVCCREPSSLLCWPPGTSPVGGGVRVPGTGWTSCTRLLDAIALLGSWVSPEGLRRIHDPGLAHLSQSARRKERRD